MSEDASGQDASGEETDQWEATDAPTTGSVPKAEAPVPHSRLVGLMAVPISRSVPIRRSTALMLVAFLGFGTLCYLYPPGSPSASGSSTTSNAGIPGVFVPSPTTTTTTTTRPVPTTTTTRVGGSTTTSTTAPSTTTTRATGTTTTTRAGGSTTTSAPIGATTTTSPGATSTTSTAP